VRAPWSFFSPAHGRRANKPPFILFVSRVNVRFWHKADMAIALSDVRFRGNSGRHGNSAKCLHLTHSGHLQSRIAAPQNDRQTRGCPNLPCCTARCCD